MNFFPFRDLADYPSAHSNRSPPRHRANVPTPRDTWVQLCATSLVEPTCQSCESPPTWRFCSARPVQSHWMLVFLFHGRSGVEHCMQLLKSYIGALCSTVRRHVCLQEQKRKSARVTLCILMCFCKSCFFIFYLISFFLGMTFLH